MPAVIKRGKANTVRRPSGLTPSELESTLENLDPPLPIDARDLLDAIDSLREQVQELVFTLKLIHGI